MPVAEVSPEAALESFLTLAAGNEASLLAVAGLD